MHVATKPAYRSLLEPNPYVAKAHCLTGSLRDLVKELRAEQFDYIVDLHHNLRTRLIKLQLGVQSQQLRQAELAKVAAGATSKSTACPTCTLCSATWPPPPRWACATTAAGWTISSPKARKWTSPRCPPAFQTRLRGRGHRGAARHQAPARCRSSSSCASPGRRAPWCCSAAPKTQASGRRLSIEAALPAATFDAISPRPIHLQPYCNGCGRYSLHQSASLLRQAQFVVSHDTGLMHIAAAFGKEIFSVWGNTVPAFGMYPFRTEFRVLEVPGLACRPCSKIGFAQCPQGHFRCMRDQRLDLDLPPVRDGR